MNWAEMYEKEIKLCNFVLCFIDSIGRFPGQFENAPVNKIEGEHKMQTLKININGQRFTAMLYDNAATQKLVQNLPVTLNMKDLHGNEKYYYLDTSLPAKAQHIGKINAGDIMLFGNDCLHHAVRQ